MSHQGVLVNLAVRSEHGLDHELVHVLLVGVVLERLKTDGDGDLIAGVNNPGVGLDTVPGKKNFTSHSTIKIFDQNYLFGAVVLILKHTFFSARFFSFM